MPQLYKRKMYKAGLAVLFLLLSSLMLAACSSQTTDSNEQLTAVAEAVRATGVQQFPTVDPQIVVGFDFFVFGTEFYPNRENEKIGARIANKGLTTVYISQCEGVILQQKQGNDWINIARARPCGSKPQKIPVISGTQQDISFEFKRASPYNNQPWPKWLTYGTHRLIFLFSTECPELNEFKECLNPKYYPSVTFELKQLQVATTPTP